VAAGEGSVWVTVGASPEELETDAEGS
jgi:hypothetical protein